MSDKQFSGGALVNLTGVSLDELRFADDSALAAAITRVTEEARSPVSVSSGHSSAT